MLIEGKKKVGKRSQRGEEGLTGVSVLQVRVKCRGKPRIARRQSLKNILAATEKRRKARLGSRGANE